MRNHTLFGSVKCHVCDQDLVPTVGQPHLRDGFYDADTQQYVHHGYCKKRHYYLKQIELRQEGLSSNAMTYSEMPVPFDLTSH